MAEAGRRRRREGCLFFDFELVKWLMVDVELVKWGSGELEHIDSYLSSIDF